MHLVLIRHGHNDWVGDRLAGWTPGIHLSAKGRAECEALARRLDGYPIDAVYSSPLERARETAEFIAAPLGLGVETLSGVGEVRYGSWTGGQLSELAKDELWPRAQAFPSGTRFPGGETLAEVQARAVAAIEALRADYPHGVVAVVSHGDVIKSIVAHYAGTHLDLSQRLVVSTASVTVLHFCAHGPKLLLFNDTGRIPGEPNADSATHAPGEAGSRERPAARATDEADC